MGTYIYFTDEQKLRANNVDLADFLRHRGETLKRSGPEWRLQSDHSITVRGNGWYDHAVEKGGYAIDFVRQFYNLSFPEAVTLLLGGEQGEAYHAAEPKAQTPRKPFALPNAHTDMRRTYAYLVKSRGIDREVVSFFAKAKLLYESCEKSKDGTKEYRNAVFVGLDENGTPRHAHKRGLYTLGIGFKGNVDSSSPAYSFHHIGQSLSGSKSNRLYVFEAPIDMLSFISLNPQGWQEHSYVALCGVGSQSMHWMLEQNPQLTEVAIGLDNDEAGHKASARMREQLVEGGYMVERLLPSGKDWNDDLLMQQQKQTALAMQMA